MKSSVPFLLLWLFLSAFSTVAAQENKRVFYNVGFYNLENLFDTIHDDGKNDYEFLPDGKYKWGTLKYTNKIKNIATVLNDMGTDISDSGMAVVAVSEIENSRVLKDLVEHEVLAHRGWKFIHVEGPDIRGIDCALLYNPELFKPVTYKLVHYTTEKNDTSYKTRGFLVVGGYLAGELVYMIVNHWPSRYVDTSVRERAGKLVRCLKNEIMHENPQVKVFVIGDMNDNPEDKSVAVSLGAICDRQHVKSSADLYNPWGKMLRRNSSGTYCYNDKWNIFDQIILSGNMLDCDASSLKFHKAEIFSRGYMFQQRGRFRGSIKRTHTAGVWLNGYSDHLPVIVSLVKEGK